MVKRILVIDNDLELCSSIQQYMQGDRVEVVYAAYNGGDFSRLWKENCCLAIINAVFQKVDCIEMIRTMRETRYIPILLLADPLLPWEKTEAFQVGANAYLEKPVDLEVCVAQARSLIQLYKGSNGRCGSVLFGTELMINLSHRQAFIDGKLLQLTRKEFDLLYFFASSPGQVFSRNQLYACVWKECVLTDCEETVKTHIKTLRKKLAAEGRHYIHNIWGIGYKFVLDDQ